MESIGRLARRRQGSSKAVRQDVGGTQQIEAWENGATPLRLCAFA
jgi:hypothetical protein